MDSEKLGNEIVKRLKENTLKKCINFKLKNEKAGLMENKIGGIPFIPKGGEYPTNLINGKKLYLLAQLNFETLPYIENYPKNGIIQFFIYDDDLYGADFNHKPSKQDSWRIVYYNDISNPMSEEEIKKLVPEKIEYEYGLPFEYGKEYKLEYELSEMCITLNDCHFEKIYHKYCDDILKDKFKNKEIWELPEDINDIINDNLYGEGTRLGGYPAFTQSDPRDENDGYELLFQIDTEWYDDEDRGCQKDYIMWGDCGIANFFIKPHDLKICNFKDVLYNWDCC